MAPLLQLQKRNARSPSPGRRRRNAPKALGNLRGVYAVFPELGPCSSPTITSFAPAPHRPLSPKLGEFINVALLVNGVIAGAYNGSAERATRASPTELSEDGDSNVEAASLEESSHDDDDYNSRDSPKQASDHERYIAIRPDSDTPIETDPSKVTTPATSPDLALIELSGNQPRAEPSLFSANTVALESQVIYYTVPSPSPSPYNSYEVIAQQYRSDLASRVVTHFNQSRTANNPWKITLPWNHSGQYTGLRTLSQQQVGVSNNNGQIAIEPFYRVDKFTQSQLVKAQLHAADLDAAKEGMPPVAQALHVFVDMSNIVIGFYDRIKQTRGLTREQRIHGAQPPFFFQALAMILERGRPCAKKIIVGSTGAGRVKEDYMTDAEAIGYTAHILQRVKGGKTKTFASPSTSNKPPSPTSNPNAHREQAVDEILQLHMLESLADTPPMVVAETGELLGPGTMVLATGDGAATDFSEGFFAQIMRALRYGWYVEVVGFSRNMSKVWNEYKIPEEWRPRFKIIMLDAFAEELFESFHG